jgi:hypothetical protein
MRPDRRNYLFNSGDLGEVLRQHLKAAIQAVDELEGSRFKHQSDEEIVKELVHKFAVRPLGLVETNTSMKQLETKVDVSKNPLRNPFGDRGPRMVDAVRVIVSIPFVGDPGLWKLRPNSWTTTVPFGEVHSGQGDGGSLEITIEQPADEDPARIKEFLDRQLKDVRFYIENQRTQVASEMVELPKRIASAVAERRQRVTKLGSLSELLGIPASAPENASSILPKRLSVAAPREPRPANPRTQTVQWDVFVSHASEDKDEFVRPLAQALTRAGLRVWFDEFTLRVGDSLRRSIDRGLANSKFGIVVISPAFLRKEWPQKELDGLVARENQGHKVILPVWHNIDQETLAKYSPTLADRLATDSGKGLETVVEDLRAAIHAD